MTALGRDTDLIAVAAPPDFTAFLRSKTASAHRRLEASLDLLADPSDGRRMTRLLARFYGFHAVWDPAVAGVPQLAAFHAPRARLALLARDLSLLGVAAADIAALPRCDVARFLVRDAAQGLGSMYVLEGSTLGGVLISRALKDQAWAPSDGLGYFNPYGPRTGIMWREFRQWLAAEAAAHDAEAVAAGARRTFALLEDWLAV